MIDTCIYCAIIILFAFLLLYGVKKERIEQEKEVLSRLNALRGVFAIEVAIGHVFRYEITLLYPFGKFMIISVAFFFFISAFGMSYSLHTKPDYLNVRTFLIGKPLYLFLIAVLFFVFNLIVDLICPLDLGFLKRDVLPTFLRQTNWYLFELIGFYLLFYLLYRFVPEYRVLIMCGITLAAIIGLYVLGGAAYEAYYASSLAFPLGLLFGEHYEKVRTFIHGVWGYFVIIILAVFGLACLLWDDGGMISMVFMRNAICLAGVLIVYLIVCRFRFGNRAMELATKYSLEIYLSQFVYQSIARGYGWDLKVSFAFTVVMWTLTALILHPVVVVLGKTLKKSRNS